VYRVKGFDRDTKEPCKNRHQRDGENRDGPGKGRWTGLLSALKALSQIPNLVPVHTQKPLKSDDKGLTPVVADRVSDKGAQCGRDCSRKNDNPEDLKKGTGNRKTGQDQDGPCPMMIIGEGMGTMTCSIITPMKTRSWPWALIDSISNA